MLTCASSTELRNQSEKDYALMVLNALKEDAYPEMDIVKCTKKENRDRGVSRWAIDLLIQRIISSSQYEDMRMIFADIEGQLYSKMQFTTTVDETYRDFALAYKTVKDTEWCFADDMNYTIYEGSY